jgi:prepilin-type N-terminal cleavage/methylation domain-containing protein
MLRSRLAADEGFTLIELLVVILIVGILVAVGLASFLNQRAKSEDAEAKVYATAAGKAMVIWGGDHGGSYADATPAGLARIEPSLATARGLTIDAGRRSFTVTVDSAAGDKGGGSFSLERSDTSAIARTCANPGKGACAATPDSGGNSW